MIECWSLLWAVVKYFQELMYKLITLIVFFMQFGLKFFMKNEILNRIAHHTCYMFKYYLFIDRFFKYKKHIYLFMDSLNTSKLKSLKTPYITFMIEWGYFLWAVFKYFQEFMYKVIGNYY